MNVSISVHTENPLCAWECAFLDFLLNGMEFECNWYQETDGTIAASFFPKHYIAHSTINHCFNKTDENGPTKGSLLNTNAVCTLCEGATTEKPCFAMTQCKQKKCINDPSASGELNVFLPIRGLKGRVDWSRCNPVPEMGTGDKCVAGCKYGYRGDGISLVCDHVTQQLQLDPRKHPNDIKPHSTMSCVPIQCTKTTAILEFMPRDLRRDHNCDQVATNQVCTASCRTGYELRCILQEWNPSSTLKTLQKRNFQGGQISFL